MQTKPNTTKKVFFSGVLLLTLSTVLVKVVGLVYKIPMLSYLGSEGMGYFHSAYEIYAVFCIIATAGLPVALSVLISASLAEGREREAERIWQVSLSLFVIIGLVGSLLMWGLARPICRLIKSEDALGCIVSIAPTLFFVCVSSAVRGYFQGYQKMLPTAVSQLLEAVGKLVFGLLFAHFALKNGADVPMLAAAAGWGVTAGTVLSTFYLAIERIRFAKKREKNDTTEALRGGYRVEKKLLKIALPITLGSFLISLTKVVDMSMILRRLQAIGYSTSEANEAYGSYTTLAISVFALLPTLLNSIALPLIPILSSAISGKDRVTEHKMIELSYRINALIAIPASVGITLFAHPILSLLFGSQAQAVETAAPLLSILGISVFLSCMITATNSVLHAYREVKKPIYSTLAGVLVKGVTAYFLIGIPAIGLWGAPISSFLCNAVIVVMNMHFVSRFCDDAVDLKSLFVYPTLLSVLAVGVAYGEHLLLVYRFGQNLLTTLIPMATAVILYLVLGCFFGLICEEDLAALPMGKKICSFLEKLHLLSKKEFEKT
ncbi:MAG: polysaccharide biosynthesis protein [Ruminococcaceae bacterium]|nr:polysaccharide biosynthesis protein [Oscillospiraceae bacterium]